MRLLRRVWAFPLFCAHKQKEKRNRKSDSFSFGSPSWTRTNDPVGLRCPTSACGGKPPCHMLTAAPSAAPFLPHSGQSHPQQLTAYASVTQGLRFFPFRHVLNKKKKGTAKAIPFLLAPQVGLEPTTLRLTAACSTD